MTLYRGYVRNHISPFLGKIKVGALDADLLDAFYADLRLCRDHCEAAPSSSTARPSSIVAMTAAVRTAAGHDHPAHALHPLRCSAVSSSRDASVRLWALDWDYEFPEALTAAAC